LLNSHELEVDSLNMNDIHFKFNKNVFKKIILFDLILSVNRKIITISSSNIREYALSGKGDLGVKKDIPNHVTGCFI
jgi:hypothetical protein